MESIYEAFNNLIIDEYDNKPVVSKDIDDLVDKLENNLRITRMSEPNRFGLQMAKVIDLSTGKEIEVWVEASSAPLDYKDWESDEEGFMGEDDYDMEGMEYDYGMTDGDDASLNATLYGMSDTQLKYIHSNLHKMSKKELISLIKKCVK
uniref:Uncharacterized protein n=1 Tax=viral metagenome TaxID=1070528 RepID=A0A6C0CL36_9ZZZZ